MDDQPTDTVQPEHLTPSDILKPAFIMRPPFSHGDNAHDDKQFHQFMSVYTLLSSNALVYLLPNPTGMPCLISDSAIKLVHQNSVVLTENSGEQFFTLMGYEVVVSPTEFHGEASLKWLAKDIYLAGIDNTESLSWLKDAFDIKIIPVITNEHLSNLFFLIDNDTAVVVEHAIPPRALKIIERFVDVMPAPTELAQVGVGACLRVNRLVLGGSKVFGLKKTEDAYRLESQKIQFWETTYAKRALEPVIFDLSGLDAGLSDIVMHLNYVDYGPGKTDE